MGIFRTVVLLAFISCLGCGAASAERRIALVVGNSAYKNVPRLLNPVNDAVLMAEMLKKAGFDAVTTRLNLNASDMRRSLRDFGASARSADVVVIYYAGHGIEMDGNNYLIPTDAVLETDADVLDETVPVDRLLFAAEPARKLRLVILDACRDNPFAKTMKRTIAVRAIGGGLAKIEPSSPNTMIAFAAKAGSTASDGDSSNSPFAMALVEYLPKPGLDLRKAFGFVRDDVLKNTGYTQEPYVYGSLGGEDVPLVPAKPVAVEPQTNRDDAIRRDYELALQLGTRDGWNAFLARYPDGFYTDLAKGQLNKIAAEEARAAGAERARLAEQEKARLALEGAVSAEQERAAAAAKAADQARIAAERAKQIAQAKAEAGEEARAALEKARAETKAAEQAAAEKAAIDPAANQGVAESVVDQKKDEQKKEGPQKVASLPPPSDTAVAPSGVDLVKSVQSELHRVGCLAETSDGNWDAASQRSLTLFNRYAGTRFDVKSANADVLDTIKSKSSRVCPLVCDHGFRADGERCTRIVCRAGYRVNDSNECEKSLEKRPVASREKIVPRADAERKRNESAPSRPQASGQYICNNQTGCRPVRPGCRIGSWSRAGNPALGGLYESCK
ncbi:caspase family protein [Bradyrhizobium jicamae]|uniref:Caspase family protein n=1 Tax=Bradyrhizobium jicamae TaxID=280332 RepID=A0ABS5FCG4_9BRAD|nr:caspase family protein [Bradyrhizobium jicamae]MBR0794479.1 caspase family protein [Bradyrhizobium jicamae]MBR0933629.1 caspase family protein [Bradyrhizobium jicamae]